MSASIIITLLLLPLIYLLFHIVSFLKRVRKSRDAVLQWPGLPTHPILGNLKQFPLWGITDTASLAEAGDLAMGFMRDMVARFPKSYYFIYGPFQPGLTCCSPDTVRAVMKSHDPKPLAPGNMGYQFLLPWLGDGLLLSKGKKWFRNRRLLTPAFHFNILKPYMEVYNQATEVLLKKMDKYKDSSEGFCVTENISLCTLDILLQCVFSQKSNCQEQGTHHPYVAAVERMSLAVVSRMYSLFKTFNWVYLNFFSDGRKFKQDCDFVHQFSADVIAKRQQDQVSKADGDTKREYLDFLDILLSAKDEDGVGLTDLEIRNEVDTFLFEGHDTTASGLTWVLYLLAKYPEHQRKVQAEVDAILDAKGSDVIEWDDLSQLKHLTLCIKEALRIYPPVSFISRTLESELNINGKILPPGTHVDILIYSLHHNPEIWEDHMEFIPERFLPENIQKKDPFAYIPFSAGPRNCIGQNFAMHEEKVIVARILRKYDLELDPNHKVGFSSGMILKAHDDVKLFLKSRHSE